MELVNLEGSDKICVQQTKKDQSTRQTSQYILTAEFTKFRSKSDQTETAPRMTLKTNVHITHSSSKNFGEETITTRNSVQITNNVLPQLFHTLLNASLLFKQKCHQTAKTYNLAKKKTMTDNHTTEINAQVLTRILKENHGYVNKHAIKGLDNQLSDEPGYVVLSSFTHPQTGKRQFDLLLPTIVYCPPNKKGLYSWTDENLYDKVGGIGAIIARTNGSGYSYDNGGAIALSPADAAIFLKYCLANNTTLQAYMPGVKPSCESTQYQLALKYNLAADDVYIDPNIHELSTTDTKHHKSAYGQPLCGNFTDPVFTTLRLSRPQPSASASRQLTYPEEPATTPPRQSMTPSFAIVDDTQTKEGIPYDCKEQPPKATKKRQEKRVPLRKKQQHKTPPLTSESSEKSDSSDDDRADGEDIYADLDAAPTQQIISDDEEPPQTTPRKK